MTLVPARLGTSGPGATYTSAGLLILRIVVGGLIAAHGLQKMTRWLGGVGLGGGAKELGRDGFRGGRLTAVAAGCSQTGGGLLLAAGLMTPLAVADVAGAMTVAATVKLPHGLWIQEDGYEYPLVMILSAAVIGLTGPGAWSLDRLVGIKWPAPTGDLGAVRPRATAKMPPSSTSSATDRSRPSSPTGLPSLPDHCVVNLWGSVSITVPAYVVRGGADRSGHPAKQVQARELISAISIRRVPGLVDSLLWTSVVVVGIAEGRLRDDRWCWLVRGDAHPRTHASTPTSDSTRCYILDTSREVDALPLENRNYE
ncbi:DoxX family protein [Nonomuraea insulae]|uniref:DoxX family protein n=1 Tax=Nonomuraea insulae TaxID=1616787 RepID=A0ABW1CKC6_9ACTN